MRHHLKDQEVGLDPLFRYRGKNQTRLETFSDASFALAITLVVLSNTVPDTFEALYHSMRDIIPFGICMVLVMVIWYQHYIFFLRYGLQNIGIIVLNTFLIFLILIYVYPLKFLFKLLFEIYAALISGDNSQINYLFTEVINIEDSQALMTIYGIGASLIFFTLGLMYWHAMKKREELELDEYELFVTKVSIRTNLIMGVIPLLSALVALTGLFGRFNFMVAGFMYWLYPLLMYFHGRWAGKKKRKLISDLGLKIKQ